MEKLYWSISEVAALLGETTVTVRFWTNTFRKFINPARNAKGNRLYTASDIEVLKKVKYLVRDGGLSLEAVSRRLSKKDDGSDKSLIIRDSLLQIREQLEQIKQSL